MMTTLFIALAVSVLAIVGVGVGIFVRVRRKNAAQANPPEDDEKSHDPLCVDNSGIARMNESDVSA